MHAGFSIHKVHARMLRNLVRLFREENNRVWDVRSCTCSNWQNIADTRSSGYICRVHIHTCTEQYMPPNWVRVRMGIEDRPGLGLVSSAPVRVGKERSCRYRDGCMLVQCHPSSHSSSRSPARAEMNVRVCFLIRFFFLLSRLLDLFSFRNRVFGMALRDLAEP